MQQLYRTLIFATLVTTIKLSAFPQTNLFNPYDILLNPLINNTKRCSHLDFAIGYEGAFKTKAFNARAHHAVNALQLWQNTQDAIAAYKGLPPESTFGTQAQFLNHDDDNFTHGHYTPHGDMHIPLNLMMAAHYYFPHNVTFGLYLPYYYAELTHVHWIEDKNNSYFEAVEDQTPLAPHWTKGWKRHGFGDLAALGWWHYDFRQSKPWLKNVRLGLRAGLTFPTGHIEYQDVLLGLPFGNDGGMGILFGSTLDLWYKHNVRLLLDVEFLHLFGNEHDRYIKTDDNQTDLFLLTKARTFKDPGFTQHYTLAAEKANLFITGLKAQIAYQYQKHNDDKYYVSTNAFAPAIINDAESVQEWTTHSLVGLVRYDFCHTSDHLQPSLTAWAKWGFNGKRAILADTAGIQFAIDF